MQPESRVYLLAGQSNMAGRGNAAELPPELRSPLADIPFFYETDFGRDRTTTPPSRSDGWTTLRPQPRRPSVPADHFGPEISFGRRIREIETGVHHAIIKVAYGGTDLVRDWCPGSRDGLGCYARMMETANEALQSLPSSHMAALVWMQGEADAMDEAKADAYEDNLLRFIEKLRGDLTAPDLRVIVGRIHLAPALRFPERVRQAQTRVAEADPLVSLADTDDLTLSDQIHFDTASQIELGRRFVDARAHGGTSDSP